MNALPEHLGGSAGETHIDTGALDCIVQAIGIKTMIDVGCGPGGMVQHARSIGIQAFGVDGDNTIDRGNLPVYIHDFTHGPVPLKPPNRQFDLAALKSCFHYFDVGKYSKLQHL